MKKQILFLTMIIMFCIGARTVYSQGRCWVEKTEMFAARAVMPAVVLNDSIYVIGGSTDAYASTSVVEAYDVARDSWTSKANLPQKLCGTTAGAVNGKIYVIGGSTSVLGTGFDVDSVYEYSRVSNSWTRKSNIPTPIAYAAADVVDGKIYVIGGCPFGFNSAYKSVYEYDPATDTWKKKKICLLQGFLLRLRRWTGRSTSLEEWQTSQRRVSPHWKSMILLQTHGL